MADYPEKLSEMIELFELIPDRASRIDMLMGIADRFTPVPETIAQRPYSEDHRVKDCESEVYVWIEEQPDQTLKLHFAVENPQGMSAMATAVILDETLSGLPAEKIAEIPADVVYKFFGNELSMGKSMGLMGMINMVKSYARQYTHRQELSY